MNKLKAGIAVCAFVASATMATASTVVVDFDDVVTGFYSSSDSFGGLSFDGDLQVLPASSTAPGPGQSGNVARAATPPFGGNPRGGSISGSFNGSTVSFLSLIAGDSGGDLDSFNLQGFDASGALVSETGLVSSSRAISLSISGTGISRFFLFIADMPDTGGSSVIDNVRFDLEVAAVPLPASLPLLGFGALSLVAIGRRRRTRGK